ncbi:MAG: cupin domain-containing protein [Vicinamibacterales bacterium]
MTADPFSDILRLADAQSVVSGGFRAGGRWAIRFPPVDKLKFSVLVKGDCWLFLDREEGNHLAPLCLGTGDVVLLSTARGFVLASDADAIPIDAAVVFGTQETGLAQVGDGDAWLYRLAASSASIQMADRS